MSSSALERRNEWEDDSDDGDGEALSADTSAASVRGGRPGGGRPGRGEADAAAAAETAAAAEKHSRFEAMRKQHYKMGEALKHTTAATAAPQSSMHHTSEQQQQQTHPTHTSGLATSASHNDAVGNHQPSGEQEDEDEVVS